MRKKLMSSLVLFASDPQRVRVAMVVLSLAIMAASLLTAGAVLADGVPSGGHPTP